MKSYNNSLSPGHCNCLQIHLPDSRLDSTIHRLCGYMTAHLPYKTHFWSNQSFCSVKHSRGSPSLTVKAKIPWTSTKRRQETKSKNRDSFSQSVLCLFSPSWPQLHQLHPPPLHSWTSSPGLGGSASLHRLFAGRRYSPFSLIQRPHYFLLRAPPAPLSQSNALRTCPYCDLWHCVKRIIWY